MSFAQHVNMKKYFVRPAEQRHICFDGVAFDAGNCGLKVFERPLLHSHDLSDYHLFNDTRCFIVVATRPQLLYVIELVVVTSARHAAYAYETAYAID